MAAELASRPLRVLLLDPNANTPPYDRALALALAAAGCQVTLSTSRFLYEDLGRPNDYLVREHFFRLAGSPLAARLGLADRPATRRALKAGEYPLDCLLLLARIARRRPDVVHAQWSFQPELDLLFWHLLNRLRIPLVYTVHNLVPHGAGPADVARYGRLYRAADALIVHSERSAQALQDRWQLPRDCIIVAPHGPLLEDQSELDRSTARWRLGLPPEAEIVLFAGLIEPYKGLADLINGFGPLAARRPQARLVVAGKPNEPFEPYRQQLQALGLLDRSTLDLRFLPESELAAYLCAADVVVLPYRITTSSGLLFAARRFACPVVASNEGDLAEAIVNGETGLLVAPVNPEQLAVAIERVLSDRALAARLGAAGRVRALGSGGWPEAARRTLTLYRRLVR